MFSEDASKTSLETVFNTRPAGMRPSTLEGEAWKCLESQGVLQEKISGRRWRLAKFNAAVTELLKLQPMEFYIKLTVQVMVLKLG